MCCVLELIHFFPIRRLRTGFNPKFDSVLSALLRLGLITSLITTGATLVVAIITSATRNPYLFSPLIQILPPLYTLSVLVTRKPFISVDQCVELNEC